MTGLALWAVQQGLYARLTGDSALMALVANVFDSPPQSQPYPYLVIGDGTAAPDDSHTRLGSQETVTLHAWSQYAGDREVKQILERCYQLLHHERWAVPGWAMVASRVELLEVLRDPDGHTRHGVMRVRVWVQEE